MSDCSYAIPTLRHPSYYATVAMMIGSSSIDPAGSPNTHSLSMLSVPAIVMQGTWARSSTCSRNGSPFSETQRPEDDETVLGELEERVAHRM